jgi:hypothetical protein
VIPEVEKEQLAEVSSEALKEELRLRTALHAAEGNVTLCGLTEEECEELTYGRVPKRIREMARAAHERWWDDLLKANAAKPVKRSKSLAPAPTAGAGEETR